MLNDLTGVLTLSKQLDRESKSVFKLEVRVYSRTKTRKKREIGKNFACFFHSTLCSTWNEMLNYMLSSIMKSDSCPSYLSLIASTDISKLPYDQTTVLINIQDANDNSPFFIKTNYIAGMLTSKVIL